MFISAWKSESQDFGRGEGEEGERKTRKIESIQTCYAENST